MAVAVAGRTLLERLVMHMRDTEHYAARDVCIIGGGQWTLESTSILHENRARVWLPVHARSGALPRITGRPDRAHSLECGG